MLIARPVRIHICVCIYLIAYWQYIHGTLGCLCSVNTGSAWYNNINTLDFPYLTSMILTNDSQHLVSRLY